MGKIGLSLVSAFLPKCLATESLKRQKDYVYSIGYLWGDPGSKSECAFMYASIHHTEVEGSFMHHFQHLRLDRDLIHAVR